MSKKKEINKKIENNIIINIENYMDNSYNIDDDLEDSEPEIKECDAWMYKGGLY